MANVNAEPAWPSVAGPTDKHWRPDERSVAVRNDMREAKVRLRAVLEAMADKYDPTKDVSYAIDGCADNMLSDLVLGIEGDLEKEAEADASFAAPYEGRS
jgi:hypothetical protein